MDGLGRLYGTGIAKQAIKPLTDRSNSARRRAISASAALRALTSRRIARRALRRVRLIDTAIGEPLPSPNEVWLERDRERERRLEAEQRARSAEEELNRLRRELERRS